MSEFRSKILLRFGVLATLLSLCFAAPGNAQQGKTTELQETPPECIAPIEEMGGHVKNYFDETFAGRSGETALNHIHQSLKIAADKDSDCYPWIFSAYAVESLSTLHPAIDFDREGDVTASSSSTQVPIRHKFVSIMRLAEALASRGQILPMDDQLAEQLTGSKGHVLGAYDCSETTVYLKDSLSPLDIGAVLEHELEHLLHDKKSTPGVKGDDKVEVVVDETLAAFIGSWTQLDSMKIPTDFLRKNYLDTRPFAFNQWSRTSC